jgi:hypothetical protein
MGFTQVGSGGAFRWTEQPLKHVISTTVRTPINGIRLGLGMSCLFILEEGFSGSPVFPELVLTVPLQELIEELEDAIEGFDKRRPHRVDPLLVGINDRDPVEPLRDELHDAVEDLVIVL